MFHTSAVSLLDDSNEIQYKLNRVRDCEDTFVHTSEELFQRMPRSTLHDHPQITADSATLGKVVGCIFGIDELSHTSDACDGQTWIEALIEPSVSTSVVTFELLQSGQFLLIDFQMLMWVDFDRRLTLSILCATYQ